MTGRDRSVPLRTSCSRTTPAGATAARLREQANNACSPFRRARGTILVMVLVIVGILAMVAVTATILSQGERAATAVGYRQFDARNAAMSGIERAMAVLADPTLGSIEDDPEVFFAQSVDGVGGNPGEWFFTVYAPNPDDPTVAALRADRRGRADQPQRHRLADAAGPARHDGRTGRRPAGLDRHGLRRPPRRGRAGPLRQAATRPYAVKNGPLATRRGAAAGKGFRRGARLRQDLNRNGLLEPNEQPVETAGDAAVEGFNRGLVSVATTATPRPDVDSEGQPRLNVNTASTQEIATRCRELGCDHHRGLPAARPDRQAGRHRPQPAPGMTLEVDDPRRRARSGRSPAG